MNLSKLYLLISLLLILFIIISLAVYYKKKRKEEDKFESLYLKIKKDITFAVAPKFIQLSVEVSSLVNLAIEIWRIEQRLNKSSSQLSSNHKKALDNSLYKLRDYLEQYDIEIVDYTNQKFNDGLNLDVLSVEKDKTVKVPFIKETVEPTILCKGQVINKAKIILATSEGI